MSLVMDTHRHWSRGPIIRFISHIIIGAALIVFGIVGGYNKTAGDNLLGSYMIIPTFLIGVTLGLFSPNFISHLLFHHPH